MRVMSAERDELRQLIEELPDEQVPGVLADVRRHLASAPTGVWPPAWFGAGVGERSDIGRHHEELLANGFGQA